MALPQDQAHDQPRPPAPFRFLDLPAELRIMVYERLFPVIRHHSFSHPVVDQDEERPKVRDSKVTLVVESLPTAILATCKLINGEATPYLKRISTRLQTEPIRLMVDTASFAPSFAYNGFLRPAIRHCLKQHRKGYASPLINEGMMRLFISNSGTQLHDGVLVRQLRSFIEECALFMIHRSPATSIVAITRHPAYNLQRFIWQFSLTTRGERHAAKWHYGGWKLLPGPVGFMLREAMTDEFDDPSTAIRPHGTLRTKVRQEAGAIAYGPPRYYLDDVSEEEWERVWVGWVEWGLLAVLGGDVS